MGLPTVNKTQNLELDSFGIISEELAQVKDLIQEKLSDCTECINSLFSDVDIVNGKMLRPGLVLLSGKSVGKITEEHLRIAAILEMVHNATLLHDDVIDNGKKRRGQPTINNLHGNECAILLGDFLLSRASLMCADLEPKINRIIAETTSRVCDGELRQTIQREKPLLTETEYINIILEKSASVFSCCCLLGSLLGGADDETINAFSCFGENLGIAFQITDDLLDIVGNERKTGKTLGTDVVKRKLTLASIHLLKSVSEKERGQVIEILRGYDDNKEALRELLENHGSLAYVKGQAERYIAKAVTALKELNESDSKQALIETATFVGCRTK